MKTPLESIAELSNVTPLQEYDDMRHDKIYEFTQIVNVHMQLCSLLRFLLDRMVNILLKNNQYDKIKDTGIHISAYVIAIRYSNRNIANNFDIYINNLSFYNNCIFTYFHRLLATLEDTMKHIVESISFDKLYEHIDVLDTTKTHDKVMYSSGIYAKNGVNDDEQSGHESESEYSDDAIDKLIKETETENDNDLSDIE